MVLQCPTVVSPSLFLQPSMEHGSTVSRQGVPGPGTLENSVDGAECLTSSPSQVEN